MILIGYYNFDCKNMFICMYINYIKILKYRYCVLEV